MLVVGCVLLVVRCALCAVRCALCVVRSVFCVLCRALCVVRCALCVVRCVLCVVCCVLRVACCVLSKEPDNPPKCGVALFIDDIRVVGDEVEAGIGVGGVGRTYCSGSHRSMTWHERFLLRKSPQRDVASKS